MRGRYLCCRGQTFLGADRTVDCCPVVAGLLLVFAGLLDSFSEGLTEILLHPPGYLGRTRVFAWTFCHAVYLLRGQNNTFADEERFCAISY